MISLKLFFAFLLEFNDLLKDNWNSPIIITTLVRFLESLFSGSTGDIDTSIQTTCRSHPALVRGLKLLYISGHIGASLCLSTW